MRKFKINFLPLVIFLFFFNINCFALKLEINSKKNHENNQKYYLSKAQFQENIYKTSFTKVLRSMGFSDAESDAAFTSLITVLPLEILKDRGNIILPAHFEKEKIFTVNINDHDSIVLKKEKNKFIAFITSTNQANRIISNPKEFNASKDSMIRLNNELIEYDLKIFTKKISFKKGDSLDEKLNELKIENKDLKNIKNLLSALINPKTIKVGTTLLAYINEKKVIAISMPLNKKEKLLIYKINRVYISKIVDALELKVTLSDLIANNEYIVSRIDLFKNDNYKIINNVLEKGESIYELLKKYKINVKVINNILNAVKPYYDLGRIRAGKNLEIIFDLNNDLQGISFKTDKITKLQITLIDDSFKVFFYKKPYKIKNNLSQIIISSNFYNDSEVYELPKSVFF